MELKEIALFDATNRQGKNEIGFNLQSTLFTLLLSEYLKGVTTEDVEYLTVNCNGKLTETKIDSYTIKKGLSVVIPYNPISFLELTTPEQKYQEFFRVMNEFVFPVFQEKGWDYAPVTVALEKMKNHNYRIEFLLKGTPKKVRIKSIQPLSSLESMKLHLLS